MQKAWFDPLTHKRLNCVFGRGRWPFGLSEKWQNQRGIRDGERHREAGEAIPGNPLCPPPSGASPFHCSPGCWALGGGEGRHAAASHVRPGGLAIAELSFCLDCAYTSSLSLSLYLRCIQDVEIIVNVSKTMSIQYIPPELSEDCLYLNVYTPAEAAKGDRLPVRWQTQDVCLSVEQITESPHCVNTVYVWFVFKVKIHKTIEGGTSS